jgi:hypothetical protein
MFTPDSVIISISTCIERSPTSASTSSAADTIVHARFLIRPETTFEALREVVGQKFIHIGLSTGVASFADIVVVDCGACETRHALCEHVKRSKKSLHAVCSELPPTDRLVLGIPSTLASWRRQREGVIIVESARGGMCRAFRIAPDVSYSQLVAVC